MGWLAAQGAIMAIGLFIGLVCSVIGLFFGHIILFDSIALGIAAGVCCNQFTAIHPALCLVIGIATFLLLLWLQNTSIGFWLVGGLLTLIYAAVFGLLAYFISEHDSIWGWVIFGLVFLVVGALHLRARDMPTVLRRPHSLFTQIRITAVRWPTVWKCSQRSSSMVWRASCACSTVRTTA